jgi:uncharacterized membrane protein YuzA (DUF378 family)
MGKAARNEHRKLLAAFWNNLAVAAVIVGVLTPLLIGLARKDISSLTVSNAMARDDFWYIISGTAAAFVLATFFRMAAAHFASLIED